VTAHRRAAAVAVTAAATVVLGGCGNLGMPDPVTTQGTESRDLWRIFVWIALVIGAIVYGLVIFVVLRYRHRRSAGEPSQRQYHVPVEIVYTALPLVIVGVLLGLSIRTENNVTATTKDPDLTVKVVGFQWQWQFSYEGSPVVITGVPGKDPVLVLPVGRIVRLDLSSPDVVHSFWVPNFIEKRDLIPRVDNAIDINITEAGEWPGVCSEFCGLNHTAMRFSVRAVPATEFDAWLAGGGSES
jgi:cytochrome c oxidase subunit II